MPRPTATPRREDLAAGADPLRALDELGARLDQVPPTVIRQLEVQFEDPTAAWPEYFTLPEGFTPIGVNIVRVENLTDPDASVTSAVWMHWVVASDGRVAVRNISGLSTDTKYRITLEVLGAV